MNTILTLGDFIFVDSEVPNEIKIGGEQRLITHELVGGGRVIDAMGYSHAPIEWSGLLMGQDATSRAYTLDSMRKSGNAVNLSWGGYLYNVAIKTLHLTYERFYLIKYAITLEVIEDLATNDSIVVATASLDSQVGDDMSTANGLSAQIGDVNLTGLLSNVSSAISKVSSFAKAAQSEINSVLIPISQARGYLSTLITSASNTLSNVATMGGLTSQVAMISNIQNKISMLNQSSVLVNLDRIMGRIQGNLTSYQTSGQTIVVTGGDLFSLASQYLGDASKWTQIAQANNLTDPKLSGLTTLIIPQDNQNSSGVLNA